jgi:hypothetical protein
MGSYTAYAICKKILSAEMGNVDQCCDVLPELFRFVTATNTQELLENIEISSKD